MIGIGGQGECYDGHGTRGHQPDNSVYVDPYTTLCFVSEPRACGVSINLCIVAIQGSSIGAKPVTELNEASRIPVKEIQHEASFHSLTAYWRASTLLETTNATRTVTKLSLAASVFQFSKGDQMNYSSVFTNKGRRWSYRAQ